jgi:hypothetical protein
MAEIKDVKLSSVSKLLVEESMFYTGRMFLSSKAEHAECALEGKNHFPPYMFLQLRMFYKLLRRRSIFTRPTLFVQLFGLP